MKIFKVRYNVCACCGDEFETRSGRALYCRKCAPLVSCALATLSHKGVAAGPERVACAVESARERLARSREKNEPRVCATCGKEFVGRPRDVCCHDCCEEGLDLLHEYSGWTNGWDRAKSERVELVDGWRGRPVMGGGKRFRLKDASDDGQD